MAENKNGKDAERERSIDLIIELGEMVDCVNEIRREYKGRGLSWNRFRGDAISRIVEHYLQKHLLNDIKVVRSAWVEECGNEFDLLIVSKDAKPKVFTGAYRKEDVHLIIEVKGSGVFFRREDVKKRLSEMFHKLRNMTQKPLLYLSFWEAKSHAKEVTEALSKDTAFIFQVGNEEVDITEWERFLERVNTLLKSRVYSSKE